MSAEVISIENLSKAYPIYAKPQDMIWETLTGKPCHDEFWALKNITLSIKEKQRIGIVGPNGSGKSTLLKIITGNLPPTSGNLRVNGKISAMLSLNSILNPEESGLKNIRFNLIMNGCPKSTIEYATEEIIEFTELGAFIYAPVKTYSSGMLARLSFAISTTIEPEILIVDEVLGAGDGYFMGKATQRMIELCDKGKALLFVSHSTSAVQSLCDTVVWLDNGSIRDIGPAEQILRLYETDYWAKQNEELQGNQTKYDKTQVSLAEIESPDIYRIRLVANNKEHKFTDTHYIKNITISDDLIKKQAVSLGIVDINQSDVVASLDFLGSEWGRLYTKNGVDCRILSALSRKKKGGQILIKKPSLNAKEWTLHLSFETNSITQKEQLDIEFLDLVSGQWVKGELLSREKLDKDWELVTAQLHIPLVTDEQYQKSLQKVIQDTKPDIEITNVAVLVDGKVSHTLTEKQPFKVKVQIVANRLVPTANVNIKFIRSDGVFAFWQSSGMDGNQLVKIKGKVAILFLFNENFFSQGDYSISVSCANGWDYPDNYPYKKVFDQKPNSFPFSIKPSIQGLDFGQVNMLVPVIYEHD